MFKVSYDRHKTKFLQNFSGDHITSTDIQDLLKCRQYDRKLSRDHSGTRVFVLIPCLRIEVSYDGRKERFGD